MRCPFLPRRAEQLLFPLPRSGHGAHQHGRPPRHPRRAASKRDARGQAGERAQGGRGTQDQRRHRRADPPGTQLPQEKEEARQDPPHRPERERCVSTILHCCAPWLTSYFPRQIGYPEKSVPSASSVSIISLNFIYFQTSSCSMHASSGSSNACRGGPSSTSTSYATSSRCSTS